MGAYTTMGLLGTMSAVGTALGPTLGGARRSRPQSQGRGLTAGEIVQLLKSDIRTAEGITYFDITKAEGVTRGSRHNRAFGKSRYRSAD